MISKKPIDLAAVRANFAAPQPKAVSPPETVVSRKKGDSKFPVDRLREPANVLARPGNRAVRETKKIAWV
jgi:hypothetical protein